MSAYNDVVNAIYRALSNGRDFNAIISINGVLFDIKVFFDQESCYAIFDYKSDLTHGHIEGEYLEVRAFLRGILSDPKFN